jgi:FkbM family methyltransferase
LEISKVFKTVMKNVALRLGFDVQRFIPAASYAAQMKALLSWHGVDLILDVGANVGQYGTELRDRVGYTGRVVSFEPMRIAYEKLCRLAARDRCWEIAPRSAIGAQLGTVTINVAGNSASSSVLPMLESHMSAAPESRFVGIEVVPLTPLDAIAAGYFSPDTVGFLKIDTQGYESEVLDGAMQTLSRVIGVQLELSVVPLYAGQKLMPELVDRMKSLGFELWAMAPAFIEPRTARMLQLDATFFRRKALATRT